MFQTFCQTLFHMTWTAAIAALAVMALRLALKKAPRSILCALWLVVFLRMVCPVSFTLPVGFIPDQPQGIVSAAEGLMAELRPVTEVGGSGTEAAALDSAGETGMEPAQALREADPYALLFGVWMCGALFMIFWAALSYGSLRRRISDAVLVGESIYETDRIDSPFVSGILRPMIFLPVGLSKADRKYVLLHERGHIARRDHVLKPVAWLALSVHWFNPVLWLAYRSYSRDVEIACDQRVIRDFDRADTAGYAAALLHLGRRQTLPHAVPLAFGEEDARGRIESVLRYKKPARWATILVGALCLAVGLGILFNAPAKADAPPDPDPAGESRILLPAESFAEPLPEEDRGTPEEEEIPPAAGPDEEIDAPDAGTDAPAPAAPASVRAPAAPSAGTVRSSGEETAGQGKALTDGADSDRVGEALADPGGQDGAAAAEEGGDTQPATAEPDSGSSEGNTVVPPQEPQYDQPIDQTEQSGMPDSLDLTFYPTEGSDMT